MADTKRQSLETVFDMFDKDGSGKIDASELKQAVQAYYAEEGIQADADQVEDDVQVKWESNNNTNGFKVRVSGRKTSSGTALALDVQVKWGIK